ncbi:MAG: hypothetical protein QGF78_00055 [Candidatus Bathyarchaeota archaeon]|jgi:hypothetical protein|nr:hypothetical protein [Candidatus Bathyarchaeota archaeon]|tara:strand:+ start:240 stop:437 length:198 start_codon:yes stop_codon:yes gene_type:complete
MDQKKKYRVFWLVWGLGISALTLALIRNYMVVKTLDPLWIMAIAHSYASTAIIAGIIKKSEKIPA